MADPASHYQSLYRRYRPQRFDQVLGQDHVTRALRNAVREGRVGHAYLFSGPRGTGKTSTARILAKVLNCANPVDGEPDGVCDNCQAVERGQVVDWLLEQDAASKSKVDDMRDLLDRVPLGTSGNRKVIILDEVHMLSQGAENALLKTLEEPPAHVVFVLATTDPQKVRPTIRSRTQHFAFHLLPQELLAEHMRHVIADAGLSLADVDDAVTHVVRSGGGSARDTLSALDQVAALGEVVADSQPVDAILDALAQRDAGAALVAVADATATGRDPRALGEAVIVRLRDAFLALMGVPDAQEERARAIGDQLGAAGLTRALDVLGEALTELSRKPDPRVVLEVALVRLVRPDADRDLAAVLDRLERLERAVQTGAVPAAAGGGASPGPASSPPATPSPPAPGTPAGDRSGAAPPSPGGQGTGAGGGSDASGAAPQASAGRGQGAAGGSAPPGAAAPPTAAGGGGPGGNEPGGPASAARAALAAQRGQRGRRGASSSAAGDASPPADQAPPSQAAQAVASAGAGTATTSAGGAQPAAVSAGQATPAGPQGAGGSEEVAATGAQGGGSAATTPSAGKAQNGAPAAGTVGGSGATSSGGTATATAVPPSSGSGGSSAQPAATASAPAASAATEASAPSSPAEPANGPAAANRGEAPSSAPAAGASSSGAAPPTGGATSAPSGASPAEPGMPELTVLTAGWNGQVLGALPLPVRSKWRGGSWAGIVDGRARFVTPNEWHKRACEEGRLDVEKALAAHFGQRIPVEVVIGEDANGASGPAPPSGRPAPGNAAGTPNEPDDHDETLSPDEVRQLKDAGDVATGGVDLLLREFGGELVEEDPS